MGLFEDTVIKAKDVFDVAAKKTNEVIETQKLKVNAATLSSQCAKSYEALGRLYYDCKKNAKDNEAAMDIIVEELDVKLVELEEVERQIAVAKNKVFCKECGTPNGGESVFCSKCGAKLDEAE